MPTKVGIKSCRCTRKYFISTCIWLHVFELTATASAPEYLAVILIWQFGESCKFNVRHLDYIIYIASYIFTYNYR